MSSETDRTEPTVQTATPTTSDWKHGAIGGLAGGILMGILFMTMMPPVIEHTIPALFGLDGLLAGWVVHLFNSVVFGIVFSAILSQSPLREYADSVGGSAGLGTVYGIVIWILAAGIVMPLWLSAVGFPNAPPLPNFSTMSLVAHVVYGLVLGVVYAYSS